MKKLIAISLLLCLSVVSFSQKRTSNWSHPFQVLFVDDASIYGEEIQQFDYIKRKDVIEVNTNIVLVHYSGEVLEFNNQRINIKSKERTWGESGEIERPVLEWNKNVLIEPIEKHTYSKDYIRILHPIHNSDFTYEFSTDSLTFVWGILEKRETKYQLSFLDFKENVLAQIETKEEFATVSPAFFQENKFVIFDVVEIAGKHLKSGHGGLMFTGKINAGKTTKYTLLVAALNLDTQSYINYANTLYLVAIKQSNQDPRFIKLYEDFLERNPEFR